MTLRVSLHPEAIEDARNARAWYADQNSKLADDFFVELERAISLVAESPESWPPFEAGTRRFMMRRFPYFVVYRLDTDELQVIAIAHARRRPRYCLDR
jgi:plasmid stabilization system protein ParE